MSGVVGKRNSGCGDHRNAWCGEDTVNFGTGVRRFIIIAEARSSNASPPAICIRINPGVSTVKRMTPDVTIEAGSGTGSPSQTLGGEQRDAMKACNIQTTRAATFILVKWA